MPGWAKDDNVKKDGEKILNNYKKQLAEKMARQSADSMDLFSRPGTSGTADARSLKSRGSSRRMGQSYAQSFRGTQTSFMSSRTRDLEAQQQKVI